MHAADFEHWDLKPQNVMMGMDGPVIIDFVRLDEAGAVRMRPDLVWYEESGTPMAVADAKCKAGRPDGYPAADIYQMLAY
ncbi:hypothetical protein [Streptomyces sp. A244]|uniref:hypothetical protein n=1 Tax=Streptomyces sp. A244 TaxID=2137016 RepID=UPI0015E75285|nr:hypothetical protein [Streptomyces sp. A244]